MLIATGIFSLWYFGDSIKQNMVSQLNTFINTPIKVDNIQLEIFDYFPLVALSLENVSVKESIPNSHNNLTSLKSVDITFNPIELIRGRYLIYSLIMNEGFVSLKNHPVYGINYNVLKPNEASVRTGNFFEVDKAILNNVRIEMDDQVNKYSFNLLAGQLNVSLNYLDTLAEVDMDGAIDIHNIRSAENEFMNERSLDLNTKFLYNNSNRQLSILRSKMEMNESIFDITGLVDIERNYIDVTMEGNNTDFQTLISLLPSKQTDKLAPYSSEGSVYFDMKIQGFIDKNRSPAVSSHFGFKDATITNPENNASLENATFEGWFVTSGLNNMRSAELKIDDFKGKFAGEWVTGNLTIKNFDDPEIDCQVKGLFSLSALTQFNEVKGFENITGQLQADFMFKGKLSELRDFKKFSRVESSGQIEVTNIGFLPGTYGLPFTGWQGTLLFNSNSIAFNDLNGSIGESRVEAQGRVVNIFSYLFNSNDNSLVIDSKLYSEKLNLNEILRHETSSSGGDYSFAIPSGLKVRFDITVNELLYKRFSGKNISGLAIVSDQILDLRNLKFEELGGRVTMNTAVDASGDQVDVISNFTTEEIYADSLFYLFNNFNQSFLVAENIKGRISSEVSTSMKLTKALEFIPETLIADMELSISNGELNNFEPIFVLQDYVPRGDLSNLRFSELKNSIHVENETVFIPEMEIHSNVASISIGGKHTFDQKIDYKIVAPLILTDKVDPDEAFGAIEDDGSQYPRIHLLLTGTTDDYEVKLNKEGTKRQIISDLKSEVDELKKAFSTKREKKKKKLSIDEEDYFDW